MYNFNNFFSGKLTPNHLVKDLQNNIHLWTIEISESLYHNAIDKMNILSTKEIEKFYSYKFIEDKARFITSHIALRLIISLYINIPPQSIMLKYNKYNKPYLSNTLSYPLFFNLSHSHSKAIIGLNTSEIGIDIEYINHNLDITETAKMIFANEEHKKWQNIICPKNKLQYFYQIWTKKESYLKAISVGLIDKLTNINVDNNSQMVFFKENGKDEKKFILGKIEINDSSYVSYVAYEDIKTKPVILFPFGSEII